MNFYDLLSRFGKSKLITPWLVIAASYWLAIATCTVAQDERMTPPPGDETQDITALIDRAKAAFQSSRTASEVLSDATFMPAHAWPRFRALIHDHATAGSLRLTPASEPGVMLHVRGTVRTAKGEPIAGAMIYAYHTSTKGWYSDKAAHISGNSGDTKHAQLFGYLKTDSQGKYDFLTIRPAGYPRTELPAHIRIHIETPGVQPLVTEIQFDDDPRLTKKWREQGHKEGFVICSIQHEANEIQNIVADFKFP